MGPTARAERAVARQPGRTPLKLALRIFAIVLGWYAVSISIIFTNKYLLSTRDFRFPFFLTFCNNAIVSLIALVLTRAPRLRPAPLRPGAWPRVVLPIGLCTALDIGFSNWSLRHVSVAFHTMIKATIPGFVFLFGLLLRLERLSVLRVTAVALVCGGIALASVGQSQLHGHGNDFSLFGLALGLVSGAFAGLRWALSQLLVQGGELSRRTSPLATILRISPVCAAAGLGLSVSFEGAGLVHSPFLHAPELAAELVAYISAVAALVFLLLLAEFALVGLTSSLTLSIFGILKELATIALSALLLGDALNASNLAGFAICIGGAALYNYSKRGGGGAHGGAEGGAVSGGGGEGAGSGGGEDGARGEAAHVELASNGVRSSTVA